jgi:hypothetical protein
MTISHEEAMLVVQLYAAGNEGGLREAQGFIWSDGFVEDGKEFFMKYPMGSVESGYIGSIATWHETVATLWKHGALNAEFIGDWLAVAGVYNKMKSILEYQREVAGEPRLWENFEALAKATS